MCPAESSFEWRDSETGERSDERGKVAGSNEPQSPPTEQSVLDAGHDMWLLPQLQARAVRQIA